MEIGKAAKNYPKPDGKYIFDKLSSVFASGNATRDDAPNHIRVQKHVPREVAQTWVSMCPAQVYEIPDEQLENGADRGRPPHRALELRPVRRDHRQGRPPDPARGRRRPALPGGLARLDGPAAGEVVLGRQLGAAVGEGLPEGLDDGGVELGAGAAAQLR